MKTWIALLRGINVGGKNILPMAELKVELEKLKLANVKTYIQSGNVIFQASSAHAPESLIESIGTSIGKRFGFSPHLILLSKEELLNAAANNPFPLDDTEEGGKALHLFFLDDVPKDVRVEELNGLKLERERWALVGRTFYLYSPDKFHLSKLAARVERILGVPATARNLRTVTKLLELVTDR